MVQGSVLTIAAFVPVAGWVVAGGYFAGLSSINNSKK